MFIYYASLRVGKISSGVIILAISLSSDYCSSSESSLIISIEPWICLNLAELGSSNNLESYSRVNDCKEITASSI